MYFCYDLDRNDQEAVTPISDRKGCKMQMKSETRIRILFAIRVILWITALAATVVWMYYSVKLHIDGIYDVHEYATILRPVLYTCLAISFAAIAISFGLHMLTVRIRKKDKDEQDHSLAEKINR